MRVILFVMDSVGIGAMPDAVLYGDEGSDTLYHTLVHHPDITLPNLCQLGLTKIDGVRLPQYHGEVVGCYARAKEQSPGKDTTTGHWEMMGIILEKPFPVFPNGFPQALLQQISNQTGFEFIGNQAASGTEIIKKLGPEHIKTGKLIVYTSADSVFQIAAHESVIPYQKLWNICQTARHNLSGEFAVGRVIARPFNGTVGSFIRTDHRRDFSLSPPQDTVLDLLEENQHAVHGVGKISDIFNGKGITYAYHTNNNQEGMRKTFDLMNEITDGLIFTNLVDFDMRFGHRNDIEGYGRALVEFDRNLGIVLQNLKKDDLLIVTADHGCDPSTKSTDHSREYVPVMMLGQNLPSNKNYGEMSSFACIGATVAKHFNLSWSIGTSFIE